MLPAIAIGELLVRGAEMVVRHSAKAFRGRRSAGSGQTLRPGPDTPLWNDLRKELRPHLRRYGEQALLGRELDLPRQRVNAFVTAGTEMPDAERTLQLLVWLSLVRSRRRRA
jgi:hypothetical protein